MVNETTKAEIVRNIVTDKSARIPRGGKARLHISKASAEKHNVLTNTVE